MKRIIPVILSVLLLSSCTANINQNELMPVQVKPESENTAYVRSVWLTYYELQGFTKDKNEETFKNEISAAFKSIAEMGFNTVTVQVRPCADAFYRSDYFPSSKYCFDIQGVDMPYDPLEIMCNAANENGLKTEAWINPYRVSQDNDIESLSENNKAKIWYSNSKYKSRVFVSKKGIYFNPASNAVTKLIVNGVKEIVSKYNVYAIHFDDYFYPTQKKSIDKKEYASYQEKGGNLSLSDWRRENVSNMIKSVYSAVKRINSKVRFGISPASNIENDKNKLYADVEKWITEQGYIDYICPQIYFGFRNVYQPFMFTVKKWMYLTKCDMYVGLPLYKAGKPDKYAAQENENIINEFVNNNNIIARQITYLSKLDEIKGFYVFSYSSLFDETAAQEKENMLKAIRDTSQTENHNQ